jgi:hypothetical protein
MAKSKPLAAKIVKHAHRRSFQEYLRDKGRDKTTIAYVYLMMLLRSGEGNSFELKEELFLADLGLGKTAFRRARKTLIDDGWLSRGTQKIDPLTGKWGLVKYTVNIEPVAHLMGGGIISETPSPSLRATVEPYYGLAGDRKEGDTVVLHSLYADASTSQSATPPDCTPSASTLSETKEVSKEAADAASGTSQAEQPQTYLIMVDSIAKLDGIWRERTNRDFTAADKWNADQLCLRMGSNVVEAVLRNTLNERPKSAAMRWTDFNVFTNNWDRNHDEYLAWVAKQNAEGKHGHRAPVRKYDMSPLKSGEEAELKEWFKAAGKMGEWSISWSEMTSTVPAAFIHPVLRYLQAEGLCVTKEMFITLLKECAGSQVVAAAAAQEQPE